ncbi:unnamed protein product [Linum tenue]|uniref:Uncharacterized protein n=1 Tax=Linum tenue TaxID=586396 RepID=A0AAV0KI25_9ROSI|nr:unnamed protein product [Linum tenue]
MEGDEAPLQHQWSIVAPLIFSIVVLFQLASRRLELLKRNASKSEKEVQLRAEIKRLYKEASTFSQPSTFAQAAKLRRSAAAKEKELANCNKAIESVFCYFYFVLFEKLIFNDSSIHVFSCSLDWMSLLEIDGLVCHIQWRIVDMQNGILLDAYVSIPRLRQIAVWGSMRMNGYQGLIPFLVVPL